MNWGQFRGLKWFRGAGIAYLRCGGRVLYVKDTGLWGTTNEERARYHRHAWLGRWLVAVRRDQLEETWK